MEISDIVTAQVVSSGQLKAIRDKIVIDRLLIARAVLSLFPNFNVNDPANMQQLETNLVNQYPEVAPALRSLRLNNSIQQRETEYERLSRRRDPNQTMKLEIDWTTIPTDSNFENFRSQAIFLLSHQLETARLKSIKAAAERRTQAVDSTS